MKVEEPFFQNNIIISKKNIYVHHSKFTFENISLQSTEPYEGASNNYYSIINHNGQYRMYYRASNNPFKIKNEINHEPNYHLEKFCVATSKDGIHFNEKRILLENELTHNFFPYYSEIEERFIGLSGTKKNDDGLFLFDSKNGMHWKNKGKIINEKNILQNFKHKNHFDSHNSIVFHQFENIFYLYLRHNHSDDTRQVQLIKTVNFDYFHDPIHIQLPEEVYNFNPIKIGNYFISIPNYAKSYHVKKDGKNFMLKKKIVKNLLVSNSGVHFNKVLPIKLSKMNYKEQICPVNGIVLNQKKNKYLFYFQNNVHCDNHEIQCYSLPVNRFIRQSTVGYGMIKTKELLLITDILFVNFKTSLVNKHNFLIVEIVDPQNKRINISKILKGNHLKKKVTWMKNIQLNRKCKIKFHLYNCDLYSMAFDTSKEKKLDIIWSKGALHRSQYMLKKTTSRPKEEEIIKEIQSGKNYIWIRNSHARYILKDLDFLVKNLHLLKRNVCLITGDGDGPCPSNVHPFVIKKIVNHPHIQRWFIQNYDGSTKHTKIKNYPIGLDLHTGKWLMEFSSKQKYQFYKEVRDKKIERINNKIFCDIHLRPTHPERKELYEKIRNNKHIYFLEKELQFKEIIHEYRKHLFILSPRGNGLDCHRTWEALLLGCIVVTKTSTLDPMWVDHQLPVVILNKWSDLNNNIEKKMKDWEERYLKWTKKDHIYKKFTNSYWMST